MAPLLAPGDGWAAEAGRLGWSGPEEADALRRVLAPDLGAHPQRQAWWLGHVRALTQRRHREANAALWTLFEALGEATPLAASGPVADGRPLLVAQANTAAAVNTVWAACELYGEAATAPLGLILDRTLSEPWAVDSGRLRNACTRALIRLDTRLATSILVDAAASAPSKTQKEQLLLSLDLAKRAGDEPPSRLAELHVPDHGLDGGGRLLLQTHHHAFSLTLLPEGRVRVEDGVEDPTPDRAAQRVLDAQIRAIRTTYRRELMRIEALLATERSWTPGDWRRIYQDNPITRAVASRLVWRHELADGRVLEVLPDPYGGAAYTRLEDGQAPPAREEAEPVAVTLWHPRDADSSALAAWRALRDSRGLVQPFEQIDRDFTRVEPDPDAMELNQYTSSRVEAAAFADAVTRIDWHSRRGRAGRSSDAARVVYRDFPDAYLSVAVSCLEEGDAVGLGAGWFHRSEDRGRTPVALGYVPPRVYSEALRDIAVLARGARPGETGVHDRAGY